MLSWPTVQTCGGKDQNGSGMPKIEWLAFWEVKSMNCIQWFLTSAVTSSAAAMFYVKSVSIYGQSLSCSFCCSSALGHWHQTFQSFKLLYWWTGKKNHNFTRKLWQRVTPTELKFIKKFDCSIWLGAKIKVRLSLPWNKYSSAIESTITHHCWCQLPSYLAHAFNFS